MKKYFEVEIDPDQGGEVDAMQAISDLMELTCFKSVREVPNREEQGKLLEEAVGLLKRIEPNLTPQYPSTGLTPIQAFLTRYEAAKKEAK